MVLGTVKRAITNQTFGVKGLMMMCVVQIILTTVPCLGVGSRCGGLVLALWTLDRKVWVRALGRAVLACVVFLGKTIYSHRASLHQGV